MQVKTTLIFYLNSVMMAIRKQTMNAGEDAVKKETLHTVEGI
jgi:hypothetical protein